MAAREACGTTPESTIPRMYPNRCPNRTKLVRSGLARTHLNCPVIRYVI